MIDFNFYDDKLATDIKEEHDPDDTLRNLMEAIELNAVKKNTFPLYEDSSDPAYMTALATLLRMTSEEIAETHPRLSEVLNLLADETNFYAHILGGVGLFKDYKGRTTQQALEELYSE